MALGLIKLNNVYFPDPTKGRPVYNGSVYIGKPGLDPEVEANRVTVYLRQAGNADVLILPSAQPLVTGAGGLIMYQGSTAEILVDGNYSLSVRNNFGVQVYYTENATGDPDQNIYPITTGSGTAYQVNVGAGAYNLNEVYKVQIHLANTTGSGVTMAYDSLPPLPIKTLQGLDPAGGSIQEGLIAELLFDGTNLVIQRSATIINSDFRSVLVTNFATITAPQNIFTPVTFDTVIYDDAGMHNLTNPSRLTVPLGVSRVVLTAFVQWNAVPIGLYRSNIGINGVSSVIAPVPGLPATSGNEDDQSQVLASAQIQVNAGDYLELFVNPNTSGQTIQSISWFCMEIVR